MTDTAGLVLLSDMAFVRAQGADARVFIDGQFSQSVAALADDDTRFGAFCNPKGRALALARVRPAADGLLLAVDGAVAEALLTTLSRYVLRARVRLSIATDLSAYGGADPATVPAPIWPLADERRGALTLGAGPPGLAAEERVAADAFSLATLRAGLPSLSATTSGEFVPQMLNLDLLGGISFSKGCYTGQEIVARTQNLGTIKRRMLRFAVGPGATPGPGAALLGDGGGAGKVVRAQATAEGAELLAVVRLAELDGPLRLEDGRELARLELPYAIPELAAD